MSSLLRLTFFCSIALNITQVIVAQPGNPVPPQINQSDRINNVPGISSPRFPDVPDSNAIHTPKGQLFEQPAMNGDDISIMYFQLTGRRVLPTAAAAAAEIKIVQPGPLTNQDVVDIIETALIMEGYALMEVPGNSSQLRLVPAAGGAMNTRNVGTRVISDSALLPSTDEIVTFSMRMQYMKPEEAARLFQSVIGQFSPSGQVTPVPSASSVIITENALLIKMLLELKKKIDVPSSSVNTKFVELTYADAEELAGQLNELINNQSSSASAVQRNTGAAGNQVALPPGLQNTAPNTPGASPSAGQNTPLQIMAETRTNRIMLFGRSSDIAFAETLIKEFDQPSSTKNSMRRKLKYLPVSEFIPIAANAIGATLGQASTGGGNTGGNNANRNQPNQNRNQSNNGNGGTGGSSRAAVGGEDGATSPESQLVGKTLLIADNISNSIVVKGPPHHLEIVENLINELDQRSEQIAITALFGKYSSNSNDSFGITLANLLNDTNGDLNIAGSLGFGDTSPSIIAPEGLSAFADIAGSVSGLNLQGFSDNFGAFVQAVKTKGNVQEISRPTIFTTNNRVARISSGSRIAVPTGTLNTGSNDNFSTNIEYRDVALELEVRPLVNGDDEVTVDISLIKDSLGEPRNINSTQTTDIDSEELETIVTVPNGSVIVLGGIYVDRDGSSDSKIPILGDIPLIGRLFREKGNSKNLDELVIMVHTKVISNSFELNSYQREYDESSYISPITRTNLKQNKLNDSTNEDNWERVESMLTPEQLDWLDAEVERQMPDGKPWIFYDESNHRRKLRKRILKSTDF